MDSRTGSYEGGGRGSGSGSTPHSDFHESVSISIEINDMINRLSNSCKKQPVQQRIPFPSVLSKSKRHLFEPHVIRIGPYHQKDPYSKTDPLKLDFVDSLCSRTEVIFDKDSRTEVKRRFVGVCTEKIYEIAESVIPLYEENNVVKDRKEFVKRLVIDGCFIVEYLNQREEYLRSEKRCQNSDNRVLNGKEHLIPLIDDDLLLLINQLPLFLLNTIHQLAFPKKKDDFTSTAFSFISSFLSSGSSPERSEAQHLLGMFHNISIKNMAGATDSHEFIPKSVPQELYRSIIYLPSATSLHESAIKLKRPGHRESRSILSVNFEHGALKIPVLDVNPTMLRLLKNLCEMEKLCPSFEPYFTAYVKFIDHIINTEDDIVILQRKHIIRHAYGSDKEAADRINELMSGESSTQQHNYLFFIYLSVGIELLSTRKMIWASFKKRYLSNPWSFFALVSALVLLVLTFLQTYYALRGYYYPHHD